MAEVKYFGEFRSLHGHFYLIEIWDEDYTGSDPIQFNVTGNGFELNYSGQTDNIYSPIIGSSASFGMYVENDDHTAFVDSLKLYQENRYYIKIWKGTYSGQNADQWYNTTKVSSDGLVMSFTDFEEEEVYLDFKWGGYIIQDILQIEDASQPYVLNIKASDGIYKLKNVEGDTGFSPLTNIFANAIFNAYSLNIFPTEWPMLKTISNWWSQQHTYDADENPLETTVIDLNSFHTYDNDGNLQKANYYEILESICRIFGIRFYFADGSFRAEQIFERDNDNIKEFAYKRNGNYISNATVTRDKTIDQTSNAARLAGNIYNFLPAVNKTQITIDRFSVDANGVVHTDTISPEIDLGFVPNDSNNQLSISTNRSVSIEVPTFVQGTNPFYAIIDVDVVLTGSSQTYYLKRDHTGTSPNAMTWTTTQSGSGLQLLIGPFYEDYDQSVSTSGTHTTPPLPVSGDVTIDTSFNKFITKTGATYTLAGTSDKSFRVEYVNIQTTNTDGFTQQTNTIIASTTNADNESGIIYDLGTTKIFDALGARGSLYERDPGTLVKSPTTGWRERNSGSYVKIQNLVTSEFLRLTNSPIQRYQGGIFSAHDFSDRLVFNALNWLQLGGRFSANDDTWDGEWFAISKETIAITSSDTGNTGNPTLLTGTSSRNGAVVMDGADIADLHSDEVTTTGAVDIGGTLDVTGSSTLATTSVGEFTTNDRVNVSINDITATPGGSETLSLRNHFNFITYSGANGTYTINLPASEDGVILRFKTDDTISNSKSITLQPNGAERIDGEASYDMDRAYDGITILGKSSGWYVIQKKEK
jgi:hypothetical protein